FLDPLEKIFQRRAVGSVAGINLVSHWKPLGRDDERHNHLHAIAPPVAAVAKTLLARRTWRRSFAFKVRACQIIEQNIISCAEELAPAILQKIKERLSMLGQQIKASIRLVLLRQGEVLAQEVPHGASQKPLAMK